MLPARERLRGGAHGRCEPRSRKPQVLSKEPDLIRAQGRALHGHRLCEHLVETLHVRDHHLILAAVRATTNLEMPECHVRKPAFRVLVVFAPDLHLRIAAWALHLFLHAVTMQISVSDRKATTTAI